MTRSPKNPRRGHRVGFALIITLMLMVLLVILVTGLLTLSAVSLRSVDHEAARTQARTNARLALALGLAQLQQQTGSDTRITAIASGIGPPGPQAGRRPPLIRTSAINASGSSGLWFHCILE